MRFSSPCLILTARRMLSGHAARPPSQHFHRGAAGRGLSLAIAAQARSLTAEQTVVVLLSVIVSDDLIAAVLDDGELVALPGQEQRAA